MPTVSAGRVSLYMASICEMSASRKKARWTPGILEFFCKTQDSARFVREAAQARYWQIMTQNTQIRECVQVVKNSQHFWKTMRNRSSKLPNMFTIWLCQNRKKPTWIFQIILIMMTVYFCGVFSENFRHWIKDSEFHLEITCNKKQSWPMALLIFFMLDISDC